MKKNKLIISGLGLAVVLGLAGCSESEIVYEGKTYPTSDVEEIIADKLEVENPSLDLELDIYEETED